MIQQGRLIIGRHSYGMPLVEQFAGSEATVRIEAYTSIARGVRVIAGGNHPIDRVSTFPFRIKLGLPGAYRDGMPTTKGDISIGSDVWIGTEAMITSGVSIGDGAVIAARAMVTKSVPPYAVVAGNPARLIKHRFDEDIVAALLAIRWWDWPDEKVVEAVPDLCDRNVRAFVSRYA